MHPKERIEYKAGKLRDCIYWESKKNRKKTAQFGWKKQIKKDNENDMNDMKPVLMYIHIGKQIEGG